ncbi:MAG: hypothetical protein ISS63_02265 [Desulfobacteraceae bacterium]|nr:hypothetical protein [Desulfobacteraceae bacterium]
MNSAFDLIAHGETSKGIADFWQNWFIEKEGMWRVNNANPWGLSEETKGSYKGQFVRGYISSYATSIGINAHEALD